MKRLMVMAAGTGGHIFPGLAIAETMKARGWDVSWLGTERGMERELVPRHGVAMDTIDFSGMRGKGLMHTLGGAFRLTAKGIGLWIGVQAFINMGVNLGLLPTKGLTLPLMSYGGSGVLINCVGLAILLRIDFENRIRMRGGRL